MIQSSDLDLQNLNMLVDYLKHLTTLSTGSILLIATFWEKLSVKPVWKPAIAVSLAGFMLSVLSSTVAYTIFMTFEFPSRAGHTPRWAEALGGSGLLFTWIGFLAGILGLASFALKNITGKQVES
jgi:hypothetical protein